MSGNTKLGRIAASPLLDNTPMFGFSMAPKLVIAPKTIRIFIAVWTQLGRLRLWLVFIVFLEGAPFPKDKRGGRVWGQGLRHRGNNSIFASLDDALRSRFETTLQIRGCRLCALDADI